MQATIARLARYPVKGLNAEPLNAVELAPGRGISCDRAFAVAYSSTAAADAAGGWMPKKNFITLVRHERLAALDAHFDATSHILTIHRDGKRVARGAVQTPVGRAMLEEFFRAYLRHELPGAPRLVCATGETSLSDQPEPGVSIIGLATLVDLERVTGRPIDPLRFRANVYLDGLPPWAEFSWVGQTLMLGSARLQIAKRLGRCAATNVEPGSGQRDMMIPQTLQRVFGHTDCGVFGVVTAAGTAAVGDAVAVAED